MAFPEIWLNQALDAYVLEDKDLEAALAQAQAYIDEYQTCVADILSLDAVNASASDQQAYNQQFIDCAISVDPLLRERYESPGQE